MPLEKLADVNRPRYVVDQVLSSIQDGTLATGARLPSEAKLAELTGVGRTSVREALAALRLMGVIETRVGAGSYVSAALDGGSSRERVAGEIAEAISLSTEALQLQEARAVFESGMVLLTAARWSKKETKRFNALLEQMAKAVEAEGYENYVRLHRQFHLALAEATGNAIVVSTAKSFLEYMDHEGWQSMERQFYLPNRGEILVESLELHRGIVDALADGVGPLAAERMHDHFEHYEHEQSDRGPQKGVDDA